MEEARADVVNRLNFGNEKMKRLHTELELKALERDVLALKPEQLALELQ